MAVGIGLSHFLNDFLNTKGLEYRAFEPKRFFTIYSKISYLFNKPTKTIQVVGTNGKGSTAHFLAKMLESSGKTVGLYTSPHLFKINERIVLNSKHITDDELQVEHLKLLSILDDDAKNISYFEYLTLLAYSFLSNKCEYLILEAGLGGEFDATSAFEKDLLLITPIGIDHKEFLGDTIEAIAGTKLEAMNCDTIISEQINKVLCIAEKKAKDKKVCLIESGKLLDKDEADICLQTCIDNKFASFLSANLMLSASAFKYLGFEPTMDVMPATKPSGRFERIASNIIIDVGHNEACAKAIKDELNNKQVQLVYNSLREKDFKAVLSILKPNIVEIEIIDIDNERVLAREELENFLKQNGISYKNFIGISDDKEYLVFGSFLVVQKFIETLNETTK